MNTEQRVIFQTTDISKLVNDYRAGAATFVYTAGQYLYIGSILPFNNLWCEMGVANVNASTLSVDLWWGQSWVPAVDVMDETSGLTATGRAQWNTNILKAWDVETDSAIVTGLSGTAIYDMYWARLSWSATFSALTTLKYIGQKFASDAVLYSFYPDLNNSVIMESFATGKTTWDEQHYMAAEHIVRDLKKRNIIKSRGQLLDYSLFVDAACHKVAEIVYQALGRPYFDQLIEVKKAYSEAINLKFFNVDKNATGRIEPIERVLSTSWVRR